MNQKETKPFEPYISADKVMPEFTIASIILGSILAILFAAANAYLGLRVGTTISASIPASVVSMGVMRALLHRTSILENNMVQTVGSAGVSVASGAIFTIPVLFIWAQEWGTPSPSILQILLFSLCGSILGAAFMVPLRKALIVKEHATLPYPEGTACAEVLLAGESGGSQASTVFAGLGIAAGYKFISDGLHIFPNKVLLETNRFGYQGGALGLELMPALLGLGYICGTRISSIMFSGSLLSWMVLMPLIVFFGADRIIAPATVPISSMNVTDLWSSYIRYIGAGAVASAGIINLVKSFPLIIRTFSQSIRSFSFKSTNSLRTDRDIPMPILLFLIVGIFLILWLTPVLPFNFLSAVITIVCGFFFATVASRMVGLVGASNSPTSGMGIATLLIATFILKATGMTGHSGMVSALSIGVVVCSIASIAGDTSQDLKTGYLLGATPSKQQVGQIIGAIASAIAIGFIMYMLNSAWSYGSDQLPAPQAMLMKVVVEGVMGGNLPWTLVLTGALIVVLLEILRVPSMPFALGIYLPIQTNAAIFCGGMVRWIVNRKKNIDPETKNKQQTKGLLLCSGFIAGEGIVGIIIAFLATITIGSSTLGEMLDVSRYFSIGAIGGVLVFSVLIAILLYTILHQKKESTSNEEKAKK